jgi:hypothetical protein
MPGLTYIPGLSESSAHLLEAIGVDSPFAVAQQNPEALWNRLLEVNPRGEWGNEDVSLESVQRWIDNARALVQSCAPPRSSLPPKASSDSGLNLDEIPEVIVLNEAAAQPAPPPAEWNRPVRPAPEFGSKPAARREPTSPFAVAGEADPHRSDSPDDPPAVPLKPQVIAANDPERHNPDAEIWKTVHKSSFRSFDSYQSGESGIKPLDQNVESPRSRRSREEESTGRWVRRGLPYPRPLLLAFSALVVILWRVLFVAVLIGTPLAVAPAFTSQKTDFLLKFLWVIGAWVVVSAFYIYLSTRLRCRVCTNHIFFSKRCFKNAKAHRVPGFGLVGSLALHALIFGWFRCMYCGTAIRLRR